MSGYCHYCNTLTDVVIKVFEYGFLIWAGCITCYDKKMELEKQHATIKKQI